MAKAREVWQWATSDYNSSQTYSRTEQRANVLAGQDDELQTARVVRRVISPERSHLAFCRRRREPWYITDWHLDREMLSITFQSHGFNAVVSVDELTSNTGNTL